MDYQQIWKVRKIQLIIIGAIFFVLGVISAIDSKEITSLFSTWIIGTWIVGTLVATFSKTGNRLSIMGGDFIKTMLLGGLGQTYGGSFMWAFAFMIMLAKFIFGMIAFCVIMFIQFVSYPISSVYYFFKSRQ